MVTSRMTLPELLRWRAAASPDHCFIRMPGRELTFAEFDVATEEVASGLAACGVGAGDVVAVMAPNCVEHLLTWFAVLKLGGVHAAVNTEFRGPGLKNMLALTGSRHLVLGASCHEHVAAVLDEVPAVDTIITVGSDPDRSRFPRHRVVAFDQLRGLPTGYDGSHSRSGDTAMLLFTSGTTGQSKACALSHRYAVQQAQGLVDHFGLTHDDVLYCCYPFFHVDAPIFTVVPALLLGCTAALGVRFSASGFWDEARALGATVMDYLGATLAMLRNQPERPDDADNPVRLGWGIPRPDWAPEFERRFGLDLVDGYGLTEAGIPVMRPRDVPVPNGSCGKVVEPYEVRIVDEDDDPVGPGEVGEIIVRSSVPFMTMNGYYGMPEATSAVFRNLWLHTGDLGRFDEEGFLYFVGRAKEAIRRRGENISVSEIEDVVCAHPAVAEAAAIGVASELTEEDVMVCVVLREGAQMDASELVEFCRPSLARFMVPRYVEFIDVLPKTPTEKVARHLLAARGVTAGTWDATRGAVTTAES